MTYHGLADGEHTFTVEATDGAGNQQLTPTQFSWMVDNSSLDTTPPQTTIESGPPDPSESSSAAFTYASNEPDSSFECSLDGAPFAGCPAGGISYSGLSNGPHSFRVRATDPSRNTDQTPAGYSFDVVLTPLTLPAQASPPPVPPGTPPPGKSKPVAPETMLAKVATKTRDRTPTFRFSANGPGVSFQCKLDAGPFRSCRSPLTTKRLGFGSHTLQVRSLLQGATDPTPAKLKFKIVKG